MAQRLLATEGIGLVDTRSLDVSLKGFGCPPSRARIVVERLNIRQRLIRSVTMVGAGVALALIALPIPLVHLVLVPGALLLGVTFGAIRLGQREVIRSAEGSCPCCGTAQRLGLAGRVFRLPREVFCESCRRALDLGRE